jgi:hypothetical protein
LKGAKRDTANELLNSLTDEQFGFVTSAAAKMIGEKISLPVLVMSPQQVKGLQDNTKNLIELYSKPQGFISSLKNVSQAEAEAFYSILSPQLKSKIPAQIVKGVANNTGMTKEQIKVQMVKRWLEQDGKDPYTGLPLNFRETSMDHIHPFNEGAKADRMDNLLWIHRDVNQSKLGKSIPDWLKSSVLGVSQEQARTKYSNALQRLSNKGVLKERVKEDVKTLKGQEEKLIKEYGKYSYYIIKQLGFPIVYAQPNADRPRGLGFDGLIKTSAGRSTISNEIIRRYSSWSVAERQEALRQVRRTISELEKGEPKPQALAKLYARLQELKPSTSQLYSVPQFSNLVKKEKAKDKLDLLLEEIRAS